jgi:hypothetical protein
MIDDEWSSRWDENWQGKPKYLRKPAPAPLCPPQIPYDLTWFRTRAATMGSQRLTAWAMARSGKGSKLVLNFTEFDKNNLCRPLGALWTTLSTRLKYLTRFCLHPFRRHSECSIRASWLYFSRNTARMIKLKKGCAERIERRRKMRYANKFWFESLRSEDIIRKIKA